MLRIHAHELKEFVRQVDSLGGPGSPSAAEFWREFEYVPSVAINTALDPFGVPYMGQQLELYQEISGRNLNQAVNELTKFDLELHSRARNPYNHGDPGMLSNQLIQLAKAMRLVKPKRGAKLLDMGCGWGLSSEYAAYIGLDVHAIDINPDFVSLVRKRSDRLGLEIQADVCAFDNFKEKACYDVILFYECLHHAIKPWELISALSRRLGDEGAIVACGEPINAYWWPHWGLRLDPMSVYCIHKHGWFESGWSLPFITRCFDEALLNTTVVHDPDPDVGSFIVGRNGKTLDATWLVRNCLISGAAVDGGYLVATGKMQLALKLTPSAKSCTLIVQNFRAKSVLTSLQVGERRPLPLEIIPGENRITLGRWNADEPVVFTSETWVPAEEIGNQDKRSLAFQVSGIEFERWNA
jgi:SAM-dependent methyltransferase